MYSLELGGKFPWMRTHVCAEADPKAKHKAWVWLPDGRMGVIDHLKSDGAFGVRPITSDGSYYPNTSTHWKMEDRLRIPEEVRIEAKDLRPVSYEELPSKFRREISE